MRKIISLLLALALLTAAAPSALAADVPVLDIYWVGTADNPEIRAEVEEAVRGGANLIVISDRVTDGFVPIPSLLAVASVHNHLLRKGLRTDADIIVERAMGALDANKDDNFSNGRIVRKIYERVRMAHMIATPGDVIDASSVEKALADGDLSQLMATKGASDVMGFC